MRRRSTNSILHVNCFECKYTAEIEACIIWPRSCPIKKCATSSPSRRAITCMRNRGARFNPHLGGKCGVDGHEATERGGGADHNDVLACICRGLEQCSDGCGSDKLRRKIKIHRGRTLAIHEHRQRQRHTHTQCIEIAACMTTRKNINKRKTHRRTSSMSSCTRHGKRIPTSADWIEQPSHLFTHGMLLLVSEARISGVRRVPADLPSTVTGGVGDWTRQPEIPIKQGDTEPQE